MKLNAQLLWDIDTHEYPGKVRVRFVTFNERLFDRADFANRTFDLCDFNDPIAQEFVRLAAGKTR